MSVESGRPSCRAKLLATVVLLMPLAVHARIIQVPSPGSPTLSSSFLLLTDTATLSGDLNPTGSIIFSLQDPSSNTVDTETIPVSGNGTYSTLTGYVLPTGFTVTGTYHWSASYSGDSNNNAEGAGPMAQTVAAATPNLTQSPHPTITPCCFALLDDTVTLSGGYDPGGTITFSLSDPTATVVDTETVSVSGNGTYSTSVGYFLPVLGPPGTYNWSASYGGDGNNNSSIAGQSVVVTPEPSSLALLCAGLCALAFRRRE